MLTDLSRLGIFEMLNDEITLRIAYAVYLICLAIHMG